jgi:glycosyltransferase involved in cell wall biosynthesis
MSDGDCVVVQPWFDAPGHPAQSMVNTARSLGRTEGISYLVVARGGDNPRLAALREAAGADRVAVIPSAVPSIRLGTLRALSHLARQDARRIFFFDGHLATIAAGWPLWRRLLAPKWFGLCYLAGPERILGAPILRGSVQRFLRAPEVRLFVRTEELAQAWKAQLPAVAGGAAIEVLPSLEIPDPSQPSAAPPGEDGPLRLGVLGQVRAGKALEWLIPAFAQASAPGRLTVAGEFSDQRARARFSPLLTADVYRGGFHPEAELLAIAAEQHYLMMLYDDWDGRMEAGSLFLAARAGRPVVCYGDGWLARMVTAFNCGVIVSRERQLALTRIAALPRPSEPAYAELARGMARFGEAHAGPALRGRYLEALLGPAGHASR